MQPTASPWAWVARERRARTRAGAVQHDKYAFYGLSRKDNRQFIRLAPLGKGLLLNREWAGAGTGAPVTWRVDRFRDSDPWRVPDIKSIQSYRPYEPVSIVLPASGAGGTGGAGGLRSTEVGGVAPPHGWVYAARGWAAGAVVLALLVLIVRAAENCLHKKLFKAIYMHTNVGAGEVQREMMRGQYHLQGVRRQESDEWSTPNVTATSQQQNNIDVSSSPRLHDTEAFTEPSHLNNDLPPPYSECSESTTANINNKYGSEEPPPPYSACYVSYANPKVGIPAVHIHNRRHQNILHERAHSSTEIDNVQNDLIENALRTEAVTITTSSNGSEDIDPGPRTELVFDNGRIVERVSLAVNSINNETELARDDNVEEPRRAHIKDKVVYIDETVSENTTPDRVLLV